MGYLETQKNQLGLKKPVKDTVITDTVKGNVNDIVIQDETPFLQKPPELRQAFQNWINHLYYYKEQKNVTNSQVQMNLFGEMRAVAMQFNNGKPTIEILVAIIDYCIMNNWKLLQDRKNERLADHLRSKNLIK